MKKMAVVLIALSLFAAGCSDEALTGANSNTQDLYTTAAFTQSDMDVTYSLPKVTAPLTGSLTPEEQAGLVFMREEEKVARDVYIKMAEKWNTQVFKNILKSEQVHMNALKILLTRYNITDPVVDNTVGVFTNPELQEMYNALIERGNISAVEALRVGKDIEAEDISDLDNQLQNVAVNADLVRVYNNLKRASNFHLNAFNYWLSQSSK